MQKVQDYFTRETMVKYLILFINISLTSIWSVFMFFYLSEDCKAYDIDLKTVGGIRSSAIIFILVYFGVYMFLHKIVRVILMLLFSGFLNGLIKRSGNKLEESEGKFSLAKTVIERFKLAQNFLINLVTWRIIPKNELKESELDEKALDEVFDEMYKEFFDSFTLFVNLSLTFFIIWHYSNWIVMVVFWTTFSIMLLGSFGLAFMTTNRKYVIKMLRDLQRKLNNDN